MNRRRCVSSLHYSCNFSFFFSVSLKLFQNLKFFKNRNLLMKSSKLPSPKLPSPFLIPLPKGKHYDQRHLLTDFYFPPKMRSHYTSCSAVCIHYLTYKGHSLYQLIHSNFLLCSSRQVLLKYKVLKGTDTSESMQISKCYKYCLSAFPESCTNLHSPQKQMATIYCPTPSPTLGTINLSKNGFMVVFNPHLSDY